MHYLTRLLPALALAACGSAWAIPFTETTDAGSTIGTAVDAGPLANGTIAGTLGPSDVDTFEVSSAAGAAVVVNNLTPNITSNPGYDVFDLSLLDSGGTTVAGCADCWFYNGSFFGEVAAGSSYFQVTDTDNFGGSDLGAYSFDVSVLDLVTSVGGFVGTGDFALLDLMLLGLSPQDLVLTTTGSDFDTELALFDAAGNLLGENDDGGPGLQSALSFSGLSPGQYAVAVAGYNTAFSNGFGVSPDFNSYSGNFALNVYSNQGASVGAPAPATLALFGLGLAGLGWSRRRKA